LGKREEEKRGGMLKKGRSRKSVIAAGSDIRPARIQKGRHKWINDVGGKDRRGRSLYQRSTKT